MGYKLEGRLLEVCNCRVLCPCWIGEDPDFKTCDTIIAWHFDKGVVNGVDVSDRTIAVMAHVSVIMLAYRAGWLRGLFARLRAVGQMAFSNYIMQTVICSLVFFGYGLNRFGEWQYYQLYYLVAGIWVLQLIVSLIWLRSFLFGPLEWLWRTLTYGAKQPFVRRAARPVVPAAGAIERRRAAKLSHA